MKSLLKKLLLAAFATLVTILVSELVLRGIGVSFPLPYAPDATSGWRLAPGFAAWFGKEGGAYVQVNRQGFRDIDHPLEKPPNTLRIAVLGDSFAEAVQVPIEQTFWSLLATELRKCPELNGRQVETLNFGISGYGTAQQRRLLEEVVWQYQPDVILLAFFSGNDLRNNSRTLEPERARPFYTLVDNRLELDESFLQHPDYLKAQRPLTQWKVWLINHSRILQLLNELKSHRAAPVPTQENDSAEPGVDELCFAEPTNESFQEAWKITEAILRAMHLECKSHGARFLVATIPAGIQVHPNSQIRDKLARRIGTSDLLYPERRIRKLAAAESFSIVPLGELMLEEARRSGTFFHGFANTRPGGGHWNAEGHRFAGQKIAESICEGRGMRKGAAKDDQGKAQRSTAREGGEAGRRRGTGKNDRAKAPRRKEE